MSTTDLIDPVAVRKHVHMVHEHAAAAIYGLKHSRPVVLQLCSMAPDDSRFCTSAYNIGDVEHMTADALIDADAGKNVLIEPRLVRPSKYTNERGGIGDTMAVFALVGDSDGDTNKPFTAKLPASALIETSPDNEHRWYFLNRAIGVGDAVELGQMMRNCCGGDHCSGVPTEPFRIAGTPNYPDKRKRARNRVVVPTRLVWATDRKFTVEQLKSHFTGSLPPPIPNDQIPNIVARRPAYCRSRAKAILAADPARDRSAQFMSAMNYAALGGLSIAEVEAIARQHLNGCSGKYADRLTQEIRRSYSKIANE